VDGTAHFSEGVFVGYRYFDQNAIAPRFPFGYGLSYSTFGYSNLTVTQNGTWVTASLDVTNTGSRAGSTIAELYLGKPSTTDVPQPPQALARFQKVTLAPGATRHLSFTLGFNDFAYWAVGPHAPKLMPGTYRILVGTSSRKIVLSRSVTLQ
jgi:beta-glucosidase